MSNLQASVQFATQVLLNVNVIIKKITLSDLL